MINKKLENISEFDLQALIDNKVLEGKTIDYKKELPNNLDSSKKEFLADVTSFANSSGGDLIYGVEEENREPKPFVGLDIGDIDKEITRLDNIIRDGVEPRILSVAIKPIPLKNSKNVILIRIPKSWISPHRVILGGHAKFYARNSSGKYEMDIDEIRVAFNLIETLTERIRKFRIDRIAKIVAGETTMPLTQTPKIVLQLIPVNAFNPTKNIDINSLAKGILDPYKKLPLIFSSIQNWRYNLDGFFTYSKNNKGIFSAYTQLYRNGIIETVDAEILEKRKNKLPSGFYEKKLIEVLSTYMDVLFELSVEPPIYVFLNLLDVRGYTMYIGNLYFEEGEPIDRDLVILPESIIDVYNVDVKDVLKPIFDLIWSACGYERSLNYDEKGNWIER